MNIELPAVSSVQKTCTSQNVLPSAAAPWKLHAESLRPQLHHKCGKITLELSPRAEGCFRQQIDAARCSVFTGQIRGRVTVFFFFFWSDHRSQHSAGGTIHLYLPLSQACFARTPSLALRRVAGGLADPWGVGVTTPAVQPANVAAERSSWKWQRRQSGSLSRIRRDSAVSSTATLSHHDGQAACAWQSALQVSVQLDEQPPQSFWPYIFMFIMWV